LAEAREALTEAVQSTSLSAQASALRCTRSSEQRPLPDRPVAAQLLGAVNFFYAQLHAGVEGAHKAPANRTGMCAGSGNEQRISSAGRRRPIRGLRALFLLRQLLRGDLRFAGAGIRQRHDEVAQRLDLPLLRAAEVLGIHHRIRRVGSEEV